MISAPSQTAPQTPADSAPQTPADSVRVGFFDSGIGGYSVVREYRKLRPADEIFYTADWEFCPYGNKPRELVEARAALLSERLIGLGARIVVVACNTATAAAIDTLRARFADMPFVGMEPAIKPALLNSKSGVVGVLATANTFDGRLYKETSTKFRGDVRLIAAVGEGLVDLVERGITEGPEARNAVGRCLDEMLAMGADHIVLGCTHYHFLKKTIAEIAGDSVVIVDPARAVAERAAALAKKCAG